MKRPESRILGSQISSREDNLCMPRIKLEASWNWGIIKKEGLGMKVMAGVICPEGKVRKPT
jgi:hypothetical protein